MKYGEFDRYKTAVKENSENLVKEMMEDLGFLVVPFGYEHILPQFAKRDNLLRGQAGELIRSIPDFLIVDKETNRAYLIEVKYRKSGEIDPKDIAEFPESWVVLVEPGAISIAKAEYVIHSPHEDCFNNLDVGYSPFKNKNRNIILKYVRKTNEIFY
ncbi:hypothetical protein HYT26_04790 [Candidatus Pacearchaeota archaeon]|nr:hypothetical protein [Candidatus Pacearchaeota archaeon]